MYRYNWSNKWSGRKSANSKKAMEMDTFISELDRIAKKYKGVRTSGQPSEFEIFDDFELKYKFPNKVLSAKFEEVAKKQAERAGMDIGKQGLGKDISIIDMGKEVEITLFEVSTMFDIAANKKAANHPIKKIETYHELNIAGNYEDISEELFNKMRNWYVTRSDWEILEDHGDEIGHPISEWDRDDFDERGYYEDQFELHEVFEIIMEDGGRVVVDSPLQGGQWPDYSIDAEVVEDSPQAQALVDDQWDTESLEKEYSDKVVKSSKTAEYNGWTNYETWNWALWMDQGDEINGYAETALDEDMSEGDIARMLQNDAEENAPDLPSGPYSDILNASLREINWHEIAEHVYERKQEIKEDMKESSMGAKQANWEDDLLDSYLETALWSSVHFEDEDDNSGTPMDDLVDISDFSDEALKESREDIEGFISLAEEKLGKEAVDEMDSVSLGHNFWLTRNGHGAGFWDSSDYTEEVGKVLTDISHTFGGVDPYIGDDGKVYL